MLIVGCFLLPQAFAARIYGTVYDSTLNPLERALVAINTTPEQKMLVENGSYSFFVPDGAYLIGAYGENSSTSELIQVHGEGDYRIDLLALKQPEGEEIDTLWELMNTTMLSSNELPSDETPALFKYVIFSVLVVLALAALLFLKYGRKTSPLKRAEQANDKPATPTTPQKHEEGEQTTEVVAKQTGTTEKLTPDQRKVLSTLATLGGRVSQKELRKALTPWSEAKVSMELTELEDNGAIRKIRKGRGNIIKAQDQ